MAGLDVLHFRDEIIIPTIKYAGLFSDSAVSLLIGTALVESNLSQLKQVPSGPGRGIFQIEPPTFKFVYHEYLQRADKTALLDAVNQFKSPILFDHVEDAYGGYSGLENYSQVIGNLPFAVLIARIRYWVVPQALPAPDDIEGLAKYWSRYYNSRNDPDDIKRFIKGYEEQYLSKL